MNISSGQWKCRRVLIARGATIPFIWSLNCFDRCNPPPSLDSYVIPSPGIGRWLTSPLTNRFYLFSYFDTIRDTGIWSLIDRWLIRNTRNHNKTRDNTLQTPANIQQLSIIIPIIWDDRPPGSDAGTLRLFWLAGLVCYVLTTFKGRYLVESLVFSRSVPPPPPPHGPRQRRPGARTGQSSFLGIVTLFSPIFPSLRSSSHHNPDKVAK